MILCVSLAADAFGQSSATQLTFEVASVKPSAPDVEGMFLRPDGGLQAIGASLRNLISFAYEVRSFQISGDSPWFDTERYDIEARATTSGADTPPDPAKMRQEMPKILERSRSLLLRPFTENPVPRH